MRPSTPVARLHTAAEEKPPQKTLQEWINDAGGIVHRHAAAAAGYSLAVRRTAVREGSVERVKRNWLATERAPIDLKTAASSTARLACISVARRRGWWVPAGMDERVHVSVDPNGASPDHTVVAHWGARIAPASGYGLIESTEDALSHIAECATTEQANILWESAIRVEGLDIDALRRVQWRNESARTLAESVTGLSDSGLETIFVARLSGWGIPIRQQIVLVGRRVDVLIGERLVVQIDGFAHHSSSTQRTKDLALDAELTLRGYTVLRFSYAQVIHNWEQVERVIARAIASGAHLPR